MIKKNKYNNCANDDLLAIVYIMVKYIHDYNSNNVQIFIPTNMAALALSSGKILLVYDIPIIV